MSFVRGPNPIWFMSNLTGSPLDDTYFAFFLTNDLPYLPQAVYQDPNGINPWSDPIEFQPSSGLPNNLYFDPDKVYRIEIRQGNTQVDPLIWLVQNYTVGEGSISPFSDPLIFSNNMITNPQFSDISFVSPLTINVAGTYEIAPGWQLVVSGIGVTIITHTSISGNSDITGNPPYSLTFNNTGWSTVRLIQTFSNNGAIFGHGAIAVAFTAYSSTLPTPLTVTYEPSETLGNAQTIYNVSIPAGAPLTFKRAITINSSTNTDLGESAFVNIVFVLTTNGVITLSNIQITGQSSPLSSAFLQDQSPEFQEQTYERTVDQEFHIYKDSLSTQPKDNILVGWTFALNPWQFSTTVSTNIPVNQYTADQTILIQQAYVASAVGNNVAVGASSVADNFAYEVKAVTVNNQFAIIQYIDPLNIRPYWNQILSVMVNAKVVTVNNTQPRFKVRLIYRSTLPLTVSQVDPIATWVSGTDPVYAAGWSFIKPLNDPTYTLSTLPQNFPFDKFQLPVSNNVFMTLGIVIYTLDNLSLTTTPDSILFNRVSLVPNDFAVDANPETYDDTFRRCEYYYEQSFDKFYASKANQPGLRYADNPVSNSQPGAYRLFKNTFSLIYNTIKRDIPIANSTLTFFAPDGTQANVRLGIFNGVGYPTPIFPGSGANPQNVPIAGNYNVVINTTSEIILQPGNTTQLIFFSVTDPNPGLSAQGDIYYHYIADVRLGR